MAGPGPSPPATSLADTRTGNFLAGPAVPYQGLDVSIGGHPRPIFSERDGMGSQCCGLWTPDGKYYVFQSNRGGAPSVWEVREKQHFWERVDSAPNKKWRIYLAPIDPGNSPTALTEGRGSDADPSWSPDGKSIA
jgi:hypothetical protein